MNVNGVSFQADPDELIRCREKVSSRVPKRRLLSEADKENAAVGQKRASNCGKSPRKRQRQRSKESETADTVPRRSRTPPEKMFIDEIADSVQMLYGKTDWHWEL